MRLGNDIVDLSATADHNPRFIDRILHPTEKARYPDWSLTESRLWIYWASKEAAYKAIRQAQEIPFHHREFLLAPDYQTIAFHAETLRLAVQTEDQAVFALVTDGNPAACVSRIFAFENEPAAAVHSAKAREILLDLASAHLGIPRAELQILTDNRIPKLAHHSQVLPHAVSLTHHGRYVAASLAVPVCP